MNRFFFRKCHHKNLKNLKKKCNIQENFLSTLKKKIDNEIGVDVCLWQLSYSYMKLIVHYMNKQSIDQPKILNFLKEQMEGETFQELMNFQFKKKIVIKHVDSENELRYVWEHRRDKTHPHGDVKIFCSGGVDFGRDDAGSVWCRFGFGDWGLHSWDEDEN